MLGAAVLQPTLVTGRNMINLDSEAEGVFTVSCAGGNRTYCRLPIQRETVTGQAVTLRIAELVGGHSGVEIDKGRANADMLLGRLVMAARRDAPCRLISLTGGSKDNAIPNEATAQLLCEGNSPRWNGWPPPGRASSVMSMPRPSRILPLPLPQMKKPPAPSSPKKAPSGCCACYSAFPMASRP